MVICDYYYRDHHTGKSILTGTFSSINCGGFPTKHGNCAVYVALTDVAADSAAQVVFRKEGGSFVMPILPIEVKSPDNRRSVVEIGGNIAGLPLPEEGEYEFVLLWNGMEIASRRMTAVALGMQGGTGDEVPVDVY
jgi:hypothetical protein